MKFLYRFPQEFSDTLNFIPQSLIEMKFMVACVNFLPSNPRPHQCNDRHCHHCGYCSFLFFFPKNAVQNSALFYPRAPAVCKCFGFVANDSYFSLSPLFYLYFKVNSIGNRAKHLSHGPKIELRHKKSILRSSAISKVSDSSIVFFVPLVAACVYSCCHHDKLLLPRCLWMDGDGRSNAVLESRQSIQCHYKQEIFLWICLG